MNHCTELKGEYIKNQLLFVTTNVLQYKHNAVQLHNASVTSLVYDHNEYMTPRGHIVNTFTSNSY